MKFKSWTAGIAVLTLATAPVFAEDSLAQWSYDQMVTPVGCCDSGCGDGCDCGDGCGCGCGVAGGGLFSGMGPGYVEGFSLAGALGFDSLDVGGWTEFGWTDDVIPLSAVPADGLSFRDNPDRFNLNQQYFYIGKEADGSDGLGLGFRADFMYGTDAQKTQAFGNPGAQWDNGAAFDHGIYGWALPQLYGEVAMGDFSVIIGHFYTLVGYEVVTSPDNFFYSHSLTMFNSEPFTHTGVLGTYSGYENMTLYGGWTLGWDTGFTNANSGNSWLGGFSVNVNDNVTATYINTYGNFGLRDGGNDGSYSHSVVFDVTLTDNLNYVAQSDYVDIDPIDNNGGAVIANDQIGINQYLFYTWNDAITLGTRIEWWKSDGVSYNEYTSGVNIRLLDNLVLRPEYRKDWSPGNRSNQENVACDMILTY